MLNPLVLVALGAVGYLSAAIVRERGAPLRFMPATALRVGVGISLTSIVLGFAWGWVRFRPRSGGAA